MKRKILGIVFLLALTAPLLLMFLVLKSQLLEVRQSVEEKFERGFEKDRILTFEFTPAEIKEKLRWEHDREFEYEGQMYDVLDRSEIDDLIYLTVYADHEETELKLKLAKLLEGDLEQNKEKNSRRSDFHYTLFQSNSQSWVLNPTFQHLGEPIALPEDFFDLPMKSPTSPPPEPHR
ncbi:MAG: hypothetical protein ACQEW9_04270 [Bacteroidota bacterium]